MRQVLITGAAGNLGGKLRRHLEGRVQLRLLDRDPRGDTKIVTADMATWGDWPKEFDGVDTVFHFAADPEAYRSWSDLVGPNVDAMIHAYQAAIKGGVRRFVFASSNHVMGGYLQRPNVTIRSDTAPAPGIRYALEGVVRDTTAYGAAKLMGERLGKCHAEAHGLQTIAVRLGWVWRGGANEPANLPRNRGEWFRMMWLSDRDFLHLMDRCLDAEIASSFVIVNGMSANTGMQWDIEEAREIVGYKAQDDVTRETEAWPATGVENEKARGQ